MTRIMTISSLMLFLIVPIASSKELLSEHQTVAVAVDNRANLFGYHLHLYRIANPSARKAMLEMLSDKEHLPAILRILGYIGRSEDISLMEASLPQSKNDISVTSADIQVRAFMGALGIMARRGVLGANERLVEMMDESYWNGFLVDGAGLGDRVLSSADRLCILALEGYALAGNKDLEVRCSNMRERFRNRSSTDLKYIDSVIDIGSLLSFRENYSRKENEAISDEDRKTIDRNMRSLGYKENSPELHTKTEGGTSGVIMDKTITEPHHSRPMVFYLIICLTSVGCLICIVLAARVPSTPHRLICILVIGLLSIAVIITWNSWPTRTPITSTRPSAGNRRSQDQAVGSQGSDQVKAIKGIPGIEEPPRLPRKLNPSEKEAYFKESQEQFDVISKAFSMGKAFDSTVGVMDNGSPIKLPVPENVAKEYETDIGTTAALLYVIGLRPQERDDFKIYLRNDGTDAGDELEAEDVVVTFRIHGTQQLTNQRKELKRLRGVKTGKFNLATIDKDGNFIVCMLKRDGKWYWNPFGW